MRELSCAVLHYTMKSLALILGLLAAVHVYNITIQLCTAVLFELAVEILNYVFHQIQNQEYHYS
jgi:hypothetical protein